MDMVLMPYRLDRLACFLPSVSRLVPDTEQARQDWGHRCRHPAGRPSGPAGHSRQRQIDGDGGFAHAALAAGDGDDVAPRRECRWRWRRLAVHRRLGCGTVGAMVMPGLAGPRWSSCAVSTAVTDIMPGSLATAASQTSATVPTGGRASGATSSAKPTWPSLAPPGPGSCFAAPRSGPKPGRSPGPGLSKDIVAAGGSTHRGLYTASRRPRPEQAGGRRGWQNHHGKAGFKTVSDGALAAVMLRFESRFLVVRMTRHAVCSLAVCVLLVGPGRGAGGGAARRRIPLPTWPTKLLPTVVNIATTQTLKAPPRAQTAAIAAGFAARGSVQEFPGPERRQRRVMSPRWAPASSSIRPATSSPTTM